MSKFSIHKKGECPPNYSWNAKFDRCERAFDSKPITTASEIDTAIFKTSSKMIPPPSLNTASASDDNDWDETNIIQGFEPGDQIESFSSQSSVIQNVPAWFMPFIIGSAIGGVIVYFAAKRGYI